ncbi:hypothetical protein HDU97_007635 [Phlyctochytrium planicorne]|nr:hypothetical protein HDU97_007635 [Phlyctochytrium planicorne]
MDFDPAGRETRLKGLGPLVKNAKLLRNGNLTGGEAEALFDAKNAKPIDAAVFRGPFIANPNLFSILQSEGELKAPDFSKVCTLDDDG